MTEQQRDILAQTIDVNKKLGIAKVRNINNFHFNSDLQEQNPETKCAMYFSPQKYWPKQIAEKYFGNKTVFALLRDPYERLVSMFRGNIEGYGAMGDYNTCDVNGAVKRLLKNILNGSTNKFASECTFLPQAEYFEAPYGIMQPIDQRLFPHSVN